MLEREVKEQNVHGRDNDDDKKTCESADLIITNLIFAVENKLRVIMNRKFPQPSELRLPVLNLPIWACQIWACQSESVRSEPANLSLSDLSLPI